MRPTKRLLQSLAWGHWLCRRTGSEMGATLRTGIFQSFSGLPNYSKKFYLSWYRSMSKENPIHFQQVPTSFQNYFKPNQKIICKIFLSFKYSKYLGNLNSFSKVKSQKVGSKGQNTFPKCPSFKKGKFFYF